MIYSDNAFNTCVTNAYQEVLAPHHPWLIRKGAGLGLSFAPKDKKFAMKILFSKNFLIFISLIIFNHIYLIFI